VRWLSWQPISRVGAPMWLQWSCTLSLMSHQVVGQGKHVIACAVCQFVRRSQRTDESSQMTALTRRLSR